MLRLSPEAAAVVRSSKGVPKDDAQISSALMFLKKNGVVQDFKLAEPSKAVEIPESWEDVEDSNLKVEFAAVKAKFTDNSAAEATFEHDGGINGNTTLSLNQKPTSDSNRICGLPVLLVNLSRLSGQRISSVNQSALTDLVEKQLHDDFLNRSTELFDLNLCIHGTTLNGNFLCDQLKLVSGDHYVEIGYPERLGEQSTSEMWENIMRPSQYKSVETTLHLLRMCCRSIEWKLLMRQELDRIAKSEAKQLEQRQNEIIENELSKWSCRRRGKLRRLVSARDAFQSRLDLEDSRNLSHISAQRADIIHASATARAELSRRIEQIDTLIAEMELEEINEGKDPLGSDEEDYFEALSDALVCKEPPTTNDSSHDCEPITECKYKKKFHDHEVIDENSMTLIDKVAAMILSRFPRIPGKSEKDHILYVTECHQSIRRGWLDEFGRLPVD